MAWGFGAVDCDSPDVQARAMQQASRSGAREIFWRNVPPWARIVFLGGVFATFSVVGFVNDLFGLATGSLWRLALMVALSGFLAVLYALCGFRGARLVPLAVAVHVAMVVGLLTYAPAPPAPTWLDAAGVAALRARLTLTGVGIVVCVVAGYVGFVTFISTEGQRYLRVRTEMVLAERIHRSLVPAVQTTLGAFEFSGGSFPSGEVGGDLVDLVPAEDGRGWVAIVADVSGHGVPSGVLTAMVKSAARMRLRAPGGGDALLADLNETLVPIIEPNMFVTCTTVAQDGNGSLTLAAAGHPPVLHYRCETGDIVRHNTSNVALGILASQRYVGVPLALEPGDVLLLVTDGLLEVFDRKDEEFGLGGVSAVLREHGRLPLTDLAGRIRTAALAHGPQADDQTLLLIRRPKA
jgi:phosphoserine phosphatase RsbU/P